MNYRILLVVTPADEPPPEVHTDGDGYRISYAGQTYRHVVGEWSYQDARKNIRETLKIMRGWRSSQRALKDEPELLPEDALGNHNQVDPRYT